jgi:hypothetical protein
MMALPNGRQRNPQPRCAAPRSSFSASGFGSASPDEIAKAVADFFKLAAAQPFHFQAKAVPLRDVEAVWNAPEPGVRLAVQP